MGGFLAYENYIETKGTAHAQRSEQQEATGKQLEGPGAQVSTIPLRLVLNRTSLSGYVNWPVSPRITQRPDNIYTDYVDILLCSCMGS